MIKSLVTIALSLLYAFWVVAIAILSIQNVFIVDSTGVSTLVTLRFLGFSSINMPLGILLALSVAVGMIGASILIPLFSASPSPARHRGAMRKD